MPGHGATSIPMCSQDGMILQRVDSFGRGPRLSPNAHDCTHLFARSRTRAARGRNEGEGGVKAERSYPKASITPKGERALTHGHPWVYEEEVVDIAPGPGSEGLENGSLVDVVSQKGSYLGTGLLSQRSKIRIRIISRNANDRFDETFWERKVRWAWEYRKSVMGADAGCCRVIFSEADGFPGLIVDRFEDVLVAQVLSIGMERQKPAIFSALLKVMAEDGIRIRGIYERNDVSNRKLEGLEESSGWYAGSAGRAVEEGPVPDAGAEGLWSGIAPIDPASEEAANLGLGPTTTDICENGVRYHVDFAEGQKTGFFLDQKYNRQAVARLARGRRVLDCFTHTGSFGLNALAGGAEHVHAVDVSQSAINMARANAQLNGCEDRMTFETTNVFDLLPKLEEAYGRHGRGGAGDGRGGPFDFIILDPPAFTKSRRTVQSAERGYHEINQRAMKLLPRGGYLATCSCSHFMDADRFRRMLASAADDADVQLRQIEERQQAPDHPILWGVSETDYLKFFLFQVV